MKKERKQQGRPPGRGKGGGILGRQLTELRKKTAKLREKLHRRRMEENKGIECPDCGCHYHRVVYVRDVSPNRRLRCRECMNPDCGRRFSTYEGIA